MISREDAIEIADHHLRDNPLPSSRHVWILKDPVETGEGWVFEYAFESTEDMPPHQWEGFGGAPGFLVDNDGLIRDLNGSEMPTACSEREEPETIIAKAWGRLALLCEALHERLYQERDREGAGAFLPQLEHVLAHVPESDMAIVRAEGLGLFHELRREWQKALEHRRREIRLMHRLYEDIEENDYDARTRAALLKGRDVDALREREEIVRSLESRLGLESPKEGE